MNVLSGFKTYIIAALIVIVAGLQSQGYITAELGAMLNAMLMGGGFAALRAAK